MTTMLPYNPRQILCPTDRSELSQLALKYAGVGARVFKAGLTVVEAVHFDYPRYLSKDLTDRVLKELEHYKALVRKGLANHVQSVLGHTVKRTSIDYRVLDLKPTQAITQVSEETQADLVVMGTHGQSGFKHWMLGSVTESVLHNARVPIFTVRQKTNDFIDIHNPEAEPAIQRILCPCDFSPAAGSALQLAASLAHRFGAHVTAVWSPESGDSADEDRFRKWLEQTLPDQHPPACLVRPGKAAEKIIETAKDTGSDLVVISAPHKAFGDTTVMGRTTELVLRFAPVPVLAVPRFED